MLWTRTIAAAVLSAMLALNVSQAQTLRVGLQSDTDALDPDLSNTIAGRVVLNTLCDKLVDVDRDLRTVPRLAQSWAWSDDGRSLTLTLRPGGRFHDGTPIDAEAVRYNIQRKLALQGSRRRSEIDVISGVTVVAPDTARIELRAPFAPLLAQFADRAGMLISPTAAEAAGRDFARRPVCSGPYAFREQVAQDRIVLRRFEEHWERPTLHIADVTFRPVPDASVRLLNLRAGSLDLIERVAASDVAAVQGDPKLQLIAFPGLGFTSIIINVGNGARAETPLGRDQRIRQALSLAIDRAALNQVVFEGANQPGNQPVRPDNLYYNPAFPVQPRDIPKAKALLREAGIEHPEVRLLVPNTTEFLQMAEIIQSMAAEAGFEMRIEAAELAASAQMMTNGAFQAYLIGWSGRTDPDGNIYAFNRCGGTNNDSHWCDPGTDLLLDQARTTIDSASRVTLYREASARFLPAMHRIYVNHENWRFAATKALQGFQPVPDGLIRFSGLQLR